MRLHHPAEVMERRFPIGRGRPPRSFAIIFTAAESSIQSPLVNPQSSIQMICPQCQAQLTGRPALCPVCGAHLRGGGRWLAGSCATGCLGLVIIVAGLGGALRMALTSENFAEFGNFNSPAFRPYHDLCLLGLIFLVAAAVLLFRALAASTKSNVPPAPSTRLDPSKLPKTFSKDSGRIKPPKQQE